MKSQLLAIILIYAALICLDASKAKKKVVRQFLYKMNNNSVIENANSTKDYSPILRKPNEALVNKNKNNRMITNSLSSLVVSNRPITNNETIDNHVNKTHEIMSKVYNSSSEGEEKRNKTSGRMILGSRTLENYNFSNQCWSFPCKNGASCYGSANSYFCYCQNGFSGTNCEIQSDFKNTCNSEMCSNHGLCIMKMNTLQICKCFESYYGANCEHRDNSTQIIKKSTELINRFLSTYKPQINSTSPTLGI